jgi:hypothetical protein
MAVQTAIVGEVRRCRTAALALKQQAAEDWAAARARFEKELLEG